MNTVTPADIYLGEGGIGPTSADCSRDVSFPVRAPANTSGSYYLVVALDRYGSLLEDDEANNTFVVPTPLVVGAPLAAAGP